MGLRVTGTHAGLDDQEHPPGLIVMLLCDRDPMFYVTSTCNGVENVSRDVEGCITLCTGTSHDLVKPTPFVVP